MCGGEQHYTLALYITLPLSIRYIEKKATEMENYTVITANNYSILFALFEWITEIRKTNIPICIILVDLLKTWFATEISVSY